jgi:DNA-binding ferritin-like protein
MFNADFEKQYKEATKQFEELAERIKDVNEFWVNIVLANTKDFFKAVKTK